MADYVLSNRADEDLTEIYLYSYRTFSEREADAYFSGISECLELLAGTPGIGRPVEWIRPGLLRHEHGRHTIFYMVETNGIFVVRILHLAADVGRHLTSQDDGGR